MPGLGAPELILILLVILVLFGWKRLPDMARSTGRSMRIFKSEMQEMKTDGETPKGASPAEARTTTVTSAPATTTTVTPVTSATVTPAGAGERPANPAGDAEYEQFKQWQRDRQASGTDTDPTAPTQPPAL